MGPQPVEQTEGCAVLALTTSPRGPEGEGRSHCSLPCGLPRPAFPPAGAGGCLCHHCPGPPGSRAVDPAGSGPPLPMHAQTPSCAPPPPAVAQLWVVRTVGGPFVWRGWSMGMKCDLALSSSRAHLRAIWLSPAGSHADLDCDIVSRTHSSSTHRIVINLHSLDIMPLKGLVSSLHQRACGAFLPDPSPCGALPSLGPPPSPPSCPARDQCTGNPACGHPQTCRAAALEHSLSLTPIMV